MLSSWLIMEEPQSDDVFTSPSVIYQLCVHRLHTACEPGNGSTCYVHRLPQVDSRGKGPRDAPSKNYLLDSKARKHAA